MLMVEDIVVRYLPLKQWRRRDPMNSRDRKNTPGEIIKRFKHKGNKPVSGNLSAQLIGLHRFVANWTHFLDTDATPLIQFHNVQHVLQQLRSFALSLGFWVSRIRFPRFLMVRIVQ